MPRTESPHADAAIPGGVLPLELSLSAAEAPDRAIPHEYSSNVVRSSERLVLLPTLNEREGLEFTLRELVGTRFRTLSSAPSIVVIDGRSTDGTRDVAASWGFPLLEQRGHGKGAAVREGLAWATDRGFTSVACMDADGTYPSSSLPGLFHLLDSGRHLAVGVRRPEWAPTRSARDMVHRVGNGLLNFAAAQFTRQPVLDICSGFWGVRTEAIEPLALRSDGFEIESELFIKAFRAGFDVAQVPITYRERVGEAKLHAIRDGARILLSILHHSLKNIPTASAARRGSATPVANSEDLDALLLSLAPRHVVFAAAPDRMGEAAERAGSLTRAIPHAHVSTETLGPDGPAPRRWDPLSSDDVPGEESTNTVVVTLPATDRSLARTDRFWVEMARSGRLIRVPSDGASHVSRSRVPPLSAPGFRRERLPGRRLAAFFILSATLEASGTQRELAFLAANRRDPSTEVYRRSPSGTPGSRRSRTRLIIPFARLLPPSDR